MTVRAIDVGGDWLYGKGRNDYLKGNDEIGQNLTTGLRSFLGDCFWDLLAGIDWFNLLGSKQQKVLELAISTRILNTPRVTGMVELSVDLNRNTRGITITYEVTTVYPGTLKGSVGLLLTESGDILITESGDEIHA